MADQHVPMTPTVRVRIAHSHTLKEGWRLAETTVELTDHLPISDESWDHLKTAARTAFNLGEAEAIHRRSPRPSLPDDDPDSTPF